MSGFNLGSLVRQVVKTTESTDPGNIAIEVFEQIQPENVAEALRQALREIVRVEITRQRDVIVPATPANVSAHSRAAAVRRWAQMLQGLERNAAGEFIRLRDFTRDDLLAAAAFRRHLATENVAKAEQYDGLAALMAKHRVKRLGDLPEQVLAKVLEPAA